MVSPSVSVDGSVEPPEPAQRSGVDRPAAGQDQGKHRARITLHVPGKDGRKIDRLLPHRYPITSQIEDMTGEVMVTEV